MNVAKSSTNPPAVTPRVSGPEEPTPEPNVVFRGGLKIVSNEVQLKDELLRYKVHLVYPQIEGADSVPIRKLNEHIERLATNEYLWLLSPSKENLRYYKTGPHSDVFNSVYLDYEVVLATDSFLSIYFEAYSYGIGAAHAVQYSLVVNYDLDSNRLVKLSDIFKPNSQYLNFISEYCIEQLSRGEYGGEYLGKDELAPVARNFASWNLTHKGIRFNFDECKLFGCAMGEQMVEIPFSALKHTRSNYGK
jgi:hypothetical protein